MCVERNAGGRGAGGGGGEVLGLFAWKEVSFLVVEVEDLGDGLEVSLQKCRVIPCCSSPSSLYDEEYYRELSLCS